MTVLLILIGHWFSSLFLHSFYLHRYAAHQMFRLSPFWDRFFFVATYVIQNVSFLNPRAYAILHRMHHAYSDTKDDPHSPHNHPNVFKLMMYTRDAYMKIIENRYPNMEQFEGGYPTFGRFEKFAETRFSRIMWAVLFIGLYSLIVTQAWQWALLPLHWFMSPIQGAIVNWMGHKLGYINFRSPDKSRNTTPVDVLMMGELFQNNHHHRPYNPNFGAKWYEVDPTYIGIKVLSWLGILKYERTKKDRQRVMTAEQYAEEVRAFAARLKQKALASVPAKASKPA